MGTLEDCGCRTGTASRGRRRSEGALAGTLGREATGRLNAVPPLPPDECGIVAQISEPLAAADIPAYYISTFKFDHALVSVQHRPLPWDKGSQSQGSQLFASSCPLQVPEENITGVISTLKVSQAEKH